VTHHRFYRMPDGSRTQDEEASIQEWKRHETKLKRIFPNVAVYREGQGTTLGRYSTVGPYVAIKILELNDENQKLHDENKKLTKNLEELAEYAERASLYL